MANLSQSNKNLIKKERLIFAHNVKEARTQAGLTQGDVVKKTGLTQAFLSNIENARSTISLDNANVLAKALKQPLWRLLAPVQKRSLQNREEILS